MAIVDRTIAPVISPILSPVLAPADQALARQVVEDMIGFWVMWHLYGGFEGLQRFGMHKATIWRKISRFRKMTGSHPDEFVMPGVSIDVEAYWEAAVKKVGPRP
jgi:hypothetical protein